MVQVSFVFGLEVNWSLLQAKIAREADEAERRKEQHRLDLERLNADRRRRKRRSLGLGSDSEGDEGEGEEREDDGEASALDDCAPSETTLCTRASPEVGLTKILRVSSPKDDGDDSEGSLDEFEASNKPSSRRESPPMKSHKRPSPPTTGRGRMRGEAVSDSSDSEEDDSGSARKRLRRSTCGASPKSTTHEANARRRIMKQVTKVMFTLPLCNAQSVLL